METLQRTTRASPIGFSTSGTEYFDWIFSEAVKVNPAAVSHSYCFDVDVYERHDAGEAKSFLGMSASRYVKDVLVGCRKVYHIIMINGDYFYSLDEPEFLK